MRMNNMSSTMLHIGERLLVSHPDFAIVVQRKPKLLVVLNHGGFSNNIICSRKNCGQGPVQSHDQKVAEVMAWNGGKTCWLRHQRIHRQHALDPAQLAGLHDLFHDRFGASGVVPAAAPAGTWPSRRGRGRIKQLVNNKTPVTITD